MASTLWKKGSCNRKRKTGKEKQIERKECRNETTNRNEKNERNERTKTKDKGCMERKDGWTSRISNS